MWGWSLRMWTYQLFGKLHLNFKTGAQFCGWSWVQCLKKETEFGRRGALTCVYAWRNVANFKYIWGKVDISDLLDLKFTRKKIVTFIKNVYLSNFTSVVTCTDLRHDYWPDQNYVRVFTMLWRQVKSFVTFCVNCDVFIVIWWGCFITGAVTHHSPCFVTRHSLSRLFSNCRVWGMPTTERST